MSREKKEAKPKRSPSHLIKGNSSLVIKLSFHTFSRMFTAFITIDILLCLLFSGYTLWLAEVNIAHFLDQHPMVENGLSDQSSLSLLDYEITTHGEKSAMLAKDLEPLQQGKNKQRLSEKTKKTSKFSQKIHQYTPLKDYPAERKIVRTTDQQSLRNQFRSLTYKIDIASANVTISYALGEALYRQYYLAMIFLGTELFMLFIGTGNSIAKIRRLLRPLSQMTEQAQSLSASDGFAGETEALRSLAGTIQTIDASKLDKRIPVASTDNELSALALAINSMLNRIDEAYHSQMRFVSDASHELRTPISVIQGYVNLLDRWGKNDESTLQESIDAIKSEAESMKDLIEQLLFLARGDNETLRLSPDHFDLAKIMEEVKKETELIDLQHQFESNASGVCPVYADRQLIKQAVRILIENSIKFTPAQGVITLHVQTESNTVRLSVRDEGLGISPQDLPHIFDRFYRSDSSRARKTGGSGLGLSIMKWIIDRHGGSIEVVSRKDIGTRTTIILPKSSQSLENQSAEAKEEECTPHL